MASLVGTNLTMVLGDVVYQVEGRAPLAQSESGPHGWVMLEPPADFFGPTVTMASAWEDQDPEEVVAGTVEAFERIKNTTQREICEDLWSS